MQLNNVELLQTGIFINNDWENVSTQFPVMNPATGKVIANVSDAGAAHCLKAIDAASAALDKWSNSTAKERSSLLRKWYGLIMQHVSDLAMLLTTEQGKPIAEAKGEVIYGASFIEWNAEECRRVYGEVIPTPAAGKRMITIKQPVGVVAAITPWNFQWQWSPGRSHLHWQRDVPLF
jgi:succinate-semialdehyde dehydrogenase / glutarate-semialdehyde dehydrogenase